MNLRLRLSLVFVLAVLVPLLVGAILVGTVVPGTLTSQVDDRLTAASGGATAQLTQLCAQARLAAALLARQAAAQGAPVAVRDAVSGGARYAVVTAPDGRTRAAAGTAPGGGQPVPAAVDGCGSAGGGAAAGVLGAAVSVRDSAGRPLGAAAVALPPTPALGGQAGSSQVDVTLVASGRVVASTLPAARQPEVLRALPRAGTSGRPVSAGGLRLLAAPAAVSGLTVVVSAAAPSVAGLEALIGAVLAGGLVLAALVATRLARVTTRPLAELSDAAARVAGGDLETRIRVQSSDEVGRLAAAFNEMTDELRAHIGELETSRAVLRHNIDRLGEALSGSHDLSRILEVVLDGAMTIAHARAGGVHLDTGPGGGLMLRAGKGLTGRELPASVSAVGEPPEGTRSGPTLRMPLRGNLRPLGLITLFDRTDGADFDDDDLAAVRAFAGQAAVAIDNVRLHQEAQHLSTTDERTGLANYRSFAATFGRELERASRFHRPLGLLMLDIDHFKAVNDTYGHQRGDAVLTQLSQRVVGCVREVDLVARYGGEELAVLLPETDVDGAGRAAERICAEIRETPFDGGAEAPFTVTVSIGVSVFPIHGSSQQALIRAADTALYQAKDAGRDRWRTAAPTAALGPQR